MIVCDVCRAEPAKRVRIIQDIETGPRPEQKVLKGYDLCRACIDSLTSSGWNSLAKRRERYLQELERGTHDQP